MNLTGVYNLEISPTTIALISANSTAQIAIWPYRSIKSYGKSAGKVNIETGRAAECGMGKFVFVSTCSREIFGIINRNIRMLRDERDKLRLMKETQQVDEAVSSMKKTREAKASTKRNSSGSTKSKHNSAHSKPRPRPSKPAPYEETHKGSGVPSGRSGTYRTSRDMEDTTDGFSLGICGIAKAAVQRVEGTLIILPKEQHQHLPNLRMCRHCTPQSANHTGSLPLTHPVK